MDEQQGFFGRVSSWFTRPLFTQGSPANWFLGIGLVLVALLFWQWILLNLAHDIE